MAMDVLKYTKKSVLDIWNAYHLVPIREEDRRQDHIHHRRRDLQVFVCPTRILGEWGWIYS